MNTASQNTADAPFGTGVFQNEPVRQNVQSHSRIPMFMLGIIIVLIFALGVVVTLLVIRPSQVAIPPHQPAPQPATLLELVDASLAQDTVTRSAPADLLSPASPIADILQGLQPQANLPLALPPAKQPVQIAQDKIANEEAREARRAERVLGLHMRMLREGVLAGVYTVETRVTDGNRQLILKPINVALSRRFMKNLLRDAQERGDITFPKGLSTEDGDVDLDTMLFNLVQNSLANDGTLQGAEAAREMTRRAFEAASGGQPKPKVTGNQTYTVEPGDSLAYISLLFYGQPGAYRQIFEANRATLKSPDRIRVGQRLIIPG